MKRLAILSSAAAFAFLLAGPGAVKGQEITSTVTETAESILWQVTVPGIEAVAAIAEYTGGEVSAEALFVQQAVGNALEQSDVTSRTVFEGSGQYNAGILSINPASGDLNNQAIIRAIAFGDGGAALQLASAYGSMELTDNTVVASGPRETRIEDSFHGTTGIVGINQSAGNLNQQVNALALTIGTTLGPGIEVLGDAALGVIGGPEDNTLVGDLESPRSAVLYNSFHGFVGIAQVNQSPGDLNRIANLLGVSLSVVNVP